MLVARLSSNQKEKRKKNSETSALAKSDPPESLGTNVPLLESFGTNVLARSDPLNCAEAKD